MQSTVIGHSQILDFFDRAIKKGALSHAYCLVGPSQIGRKHIARHIGAQLCETKESTLDVHPDFVSIQRARDHKTDKLKRDISIEQVRELNRRLKQSTFRKDGYKVAIIDDAQHLSISASNALLKTLEEPRSKTLLFLIVEDERDLLQTIVSRCHVLYVNQVLATSFTDVDEKMAAQSLGKPGVLKRWLKDQELFSSHKASIALFEDLIGKPLYEKMQAIDHLFGDKTDHIAARERLVETLGIWNVCIRDMLLRNLGLGQKRVYSTSDTVSIDTPKLLVVEEKIVTAKKLLQQNIHPRLVVETILLHLP